MDKSSAHRLVTETLQQTFDKDRFAELAKNIFNRFGGEPFTYRGKYIFDAFTDTVKTLERIGKYEDKDGKVVDILIVHLKKETTLERGRTAQRNFIARYLNGSRGGILRDAALAAFVPPSGTDWRFSFVKMEYKFGENGKVKEEFTPARRYSFLVGENESSHTAQSCLLPLLLNDQTNPSLTDLEEAFSVEKITGEFFQKYRELFLGLKESLDKLVQRDPKIRNDFEAKEINTANFAKKLLGQIVFLYFLQKKGWFGVKRNEQWGGGSKHFLRELFARKHGNYKNFFNDILEPLFYEALRLPRPDDDYYSHFDCRIPFLNGGLFDPMNEYDWVGTEILLPDDIFSNSNRTSDSDNGDGVLDIFDRYNFTVNEDEPLEKEVAVDPEMLGKVFENLLEVKDRKSKGAFYTPREIVHYMCQESLANYLEAELDGEVHKEDIETLIKYGETAVENDARVVKKGKETKDYSFKLPGNIRDNAELIDEKLATVRVCDPAVGSGEFLVGMMNEVVRVRNVLTLHIKNDGGRSPYNFKRQAIQNCLYGVDIDPGAVEIAKLRFWLSLIVDEESRKTVQPLPNLDCKVVQGNSLLGEKKNLLNQSAYDELAELRPLYFNETDVDQKHEQRKQIERLLEKISPGRKNFDFELYFSEVFREEKRANKGFDVVIGNPPYIGEKHHKEIFKEVKQNRLGKFYQAKMDLFYFFFHLALEISREQSIIAFITTNYYITATSGTKLRRHIKEWAVVQKLINFNELKLFESALGQHNMITILQRSQEKKALAKTAYVKQDGVTTNERLKKVLAWTDEETDYCQVVQKNLYEGNENYIRFPSEYSGILDRLKAQGTLLKNICNINQGIITGADKVSKSHIEKNGIVANVGDGIFVLNQEEIKALKLTETEINLLKPWFKNSDIGRYFTAAEETKRVIYLSKEKNPKDIPNIICHLSRFKPKLQSRRDVVKGMHHWFALWWPRKQTIFENAKIVAPQRSRINTFGYNEAPWYASADVYFITEKNSNVALKYILALLNSRLYYSWLYHRGKRKGEMLELYQTPLEAIPIKTIAKDEQKPFIELVDKILQIKAANPSADTAELEAEIDQLVYKLYGLTKEEIVLVEKTK